MKVSIGCFEHLREFFWKKPTDGFVPWLWTLTTGNTKKETTTSFEKPRFLKSVWFLPSKPQSSHLHKWKKIRLNNFLIWSFHQNPRNPKIPESSSDFYFFPAAFQNRPIANLQPWFLPSSYPMETAFSCLSILDKNAMFFSCVGGPTPIAPKVPIVLKNLGFKITHLCINRFVFINQCLNWRLLTLLEYTLEKCLILFHASESWETGFAKKNQKL